MSTLLFPCGCQFQVEDGGDEVIEQDPLSPLPLRTKIDMYNIPQDCHATWDLLSSGQTKGVFQLEGNLGRTWARKVKPESLNDLAALISLIRPGCLRAVSGDPPKSMTKRYCDRKHGEEDVDYFDVDALEPILKNTYGILVYQEQAMKISVSLAGFNEQEADILRKAIGKKKADIMEEVHGGFIDGCKNTAIVDKEKAEMIFGWIKESQKYSFNLSHGVSYGELSYWTAFAKTHAPTPFFCSYLKGANWKQDRYKEISELISDAKTMNIRVNVPDFRALKMDFNIQDRDIFFGLSGVRGLGKSNLKKIITATNKTVGLLDKQLSQWTWLDYLLYFSPLVSSTVNKSLINSGSLTFLNTDRKQMLYEYEQWKDLTKKEQEWVQNIDFVWIDDDDNLSFPAYNSLMDALIDGARPKKEGGACSNKNRVEKMESAITILSNPPTSLVDTPHSIAINETHHMGVALTCAEIDGCVGASDANCMCLDIITNEVGGGSIAVSLNEVKEIKTKNKKQMAFMIVSDASCTLESVVVFPDQWTEHSDKLYVGNNVLLTGHKDKDRGGFIVDDAWQI